MQHEKKVAERLSKMGIDSFVPVQQQIHQWSDRRKMVDTVLLPMMVFVHVNPKERMEVLSFSTVSRYMVMRGESTPAVIPDEQMARFQMCIRDRSMSRTAMATQMCAFIRLRPTRDSLPYWKPTASV